MLGMERQRRKSNSFNVLIAYLCIYINNGFHAFAKIRLRIIYYNVFG